MAINNQIIKYWERSTPMSFVPEKLDYKQKRQFRYSLQDYMHRAFHFDDFNGKMVLEIGCGAGIDSAEFAANGASVVSMDLTRSSTELTRDLFKGIGLSPMAIQSNATSLPFKDSTFDCVYSFGVLHHFPGIEAALAEIHRILKPGGQVMVMLYHRDSLLYAYSIVYWRGIKEGLLKTMTQDDLLSCYSERNEGCPYTRAYTKQEALDLFSSRFRQVTTEVYYNVIDLPEQRKVKVDVPDKFELGWHLIVKAVK